MRYLPWHGVALAFVAVVAALCATGCSSTGALIITGGLTPNGTVGMPYYSTLAVTGGTGTYTWTVANLPPGITASGTSSSTLVISGTPTTTGTFTVAATATDSKMRTDTATNGITISTSPVLVINGTLPLTGSVGTPYSGTLTATGGTAPYTWVIDSLPGGVTAAGANTSTLSVTGTPTTAGEYSVAITLTDSASNTAKSSLTIAISSAAGLAITGSLPATGAVGAAYSGSLTANGGTEPYTWTVATLPQGVAASGLGTRTISVAGTPTMPGTYNVSAVVTDSKQHEAAYFATVVISASQSAADSACTTAASPLGNEAALAQPYAFVLSNADENAPPVSWAGSFTPDGKGGISAADVDEVSAAGGAAAYRVNLEDSSYSFSADGSGCLYLALNGINDANVAAGDAETHTPNLGLGGAARTPVLYGAAGAGSLSSNFAGRFRVGTAGRASMFERLDSSGKNVTAFGSIYAQTAKDFGLTQLSSRFVLGADGWYFAAENEIEHTAMAGRIAFQAETGALVSGVADNNIGGDVSGELTGGRGELTAPSDKTGRGTGTYSVETTRGEVSFDFAYYVIDGGDFIFISTDTAQAGNFLLTGRALTAAAPGASLNGGYSAQMDGVAVAGAPYFRSLLGQHGKLNVTDDGTAVFRWITGNYGKALVEDLPGVIAETDSATGRTTLNSSRGALPVAYLTANTAKESIAGFLVGTDQYAASGTLHLAATPFKP
jgi:hypothetical protein